MLPRGPYTFTPAEFKRASFGSRLMMNAREWSQVGYGAPYSVYFLYILKIVVLGFIWSLFCDGVSFSSVEWMFTGAAFRKLILFSVLYEVTGCASGSGPLTGKYVPPFLSMLYSGLSIGTTRLAPFALPWTGGTKRTLVDVLLYGGLLLALLRALLVPLATFGHLWPVVVAGVLASLRDKTIFLAMRSEHYVYTLTALLFAGNGRNALAGCKLVLHAVWFWAGVSKLTHHFTYVNMVMCGNHLFMPQFLKRAMYTEDIRPTTLCHVFTHAGAIFELVCPVVLAFTCDSWISWYLCVAMTLFHFFILTNVPMGVPLEWNFVVVHSMWFFYGTSSRRAAVSIFDLDHPVLLAILLVTTVVVPIWGNARPSDVSFLLSMRYYAGLWPYSVWLFRPEAYDALWKHVHMACRPIDEQLSYFYDDPELITLLKSKIATFRAMHLHGRVLQSLLPVAAAGDIESFVYADGEILAGQVLGWNFGDGHLSDESLLQALQEACDFKPGDVRVITVEGQALFSDSLHWKMFDAATGMYKQGACSIRALRKLSPWAKQ